MDAMERVILKSLLAEAENELDEEIDALAAEGYATQRPDLQRLREVIDVRDAVSKARKYVGSDK